MTVAQIKRPIGLQLATLLEHPSSRNHGNRKPNGLEKPKNSVNPQDRLTILESIDYYFASQTTSGSNADGQVAQLVEHGPEKAGVGGSSPPLTTGNAKTAKRRNVASRFCFVIANFDLGSR